MNDSTWKLLDTAIAMQSKEARYIGAMPRHREIEIAAEELGCLFCEDYVAVLERYGSAFAGSFPIYGLRPIDMMGNWWSVVEVTKWFRTDDWPTAKDWYIISTDGFGGSIGVTPEGRVLIADPTHGCIDEMSESFEQFLLEWCLNEDEDDSDPLAKDP